MNKKIVVGNAIGKIILMGEHAVVYGEPAIAIPFPAAKVKTTIYRTSGPVSIDCFYHKELLSDAPEIIFGLKEVIKNITNSFNEELENWSDTSYSITKKAMEETDVAGRSNTTLIVILVLFLFALLFLAIGVFLLIKRKRQDFSVPPTISANKFYIGCGNKLEPQSVFCKKCRKKV